MDTTGTRETRKMIGDELGNGIIQGADIRPISREAHQTHLISRFDRQSLEIERTGETPDGYDDLEDWFTTICDSFKAAKLPIPERPGFMRLDSWTIEGLVGLADQLGRKLEVDDVTPGLRAFAIEWLRALPTPIDFEYLRDMRFRLEGEKRPLSIAQAKGVLNCAIADARRAPKATPKATNQTEPVELPDGIYFKDGVVYKVVKAVHGSGHSYAKRLVPPRERTDGAVDPVMGLQGHSRGRFEFAKGAIRELTPDDKMTLEQAREYGALYGICSNCGAMLTDEDSIERGMGPICAGHFA
jgi:hypothetical protein